MNSGVSLWMTDDVEPFHVLICFSCIFFFEVYIEMVLLLYAGYFLSTFLKFFYLFSIKSFIKYLVCKYYFSGHALCFHAFMCLLENRSLNFVAVQISPCIYTKGSCFVITFHAVEGQKGFFPISIYKFCSLWFYLCFQSTLNFLRGGKQSHMYSKLLGGTGQTASSSASPALG